MNVQKNLIYTFDMDLKNMLQLLYINVMTSSINLAFYLKHFNDATIHTVLTTTGYSSINEYETLCRRTDLFPISIDSRGLMTSVFPNVDRTKYHVFEFSIHNLTCLVQETLMKNYIGMSLTRYELEYPEYNNIYVVVPYCDYYTQDDAYVCGNEFAGWTYRMNRNTKNSYVVKPPTAYGKIVKVSNGVVNFKSEYSMPTIIETDFSGFSSPLYYSETYKGWIASLSLKQELVSAGIVKRTRKTSSDVKAVKAVKQEKYVGDEYEVIPISSDDEVAEDLSKWYFQLNPTTQNSYVLYTADSKLFKSTPKTWALDLDGLDRPIYYSASANGWIIGLRFKDALVAAGALYISRTPTIKVEAETETETQVGIAPSAVRLSGWQFRLNPTTQNSYVLSTNDSKLLKATPRTWTLDLAGLDRPVYYNETLNGWIIGLRFKDALLVSGASYVSNSHTDKVEEVEVDVDVEEEEVVSNGSSSTTLRGWQFRLNPTTKNSYVLSTNDSKLVKTTPRTWTLDLTGLDRPVYYNDAMNGWIVSLRFKDALLAAGAVQL